MKAQMGALEQRWLAKTGDEFRMAKEQLKYCNSDWDLYMKSQFLPHIPEGTLLDIGCGFGLIGFLHRNRGNSVALADLGNSLPDPQNQNCQRMYAEAIDVYGMRRDYEFAVTRMTKIPFAEDAKWDTITALGAVYVRPDWSVDEFAFFINDLVSHAKRRVIFQCNLLDTWEGLVTRVPLGQFRGVGNVRLENIAGLESLIIEVNPV